MGVKFYHEDRMSQARATLEARVLLWPEVEPTILLDCPSYLVRGHPFAVLVDGGILVPPLPAAVADAAPPEVRLQPLRSRGLNLEGWLRLRADAPEQVVLALSLVRASYEAACRRCV